MRAFLASMAIAVVLAVGAAAILFADNQPSWQAFSTGAARVGDPGHNLVGADWYGRGG